MLPSTGGWQFTGLPPSRTLPPAYASSLSPQVAWCFLCQDLLPSQAASCTPPAPPSCLQGPPGLSTWTLIPLCIKSGAGRLDTGKQVAGSWQSSGDQTHASSPVDKGQPGAGRTCRCRPEGRIREGPLRVAGQRGLMEVKTLRPFWGRAAPPVETCQPREKAMNPALPQGPNYPPTGDVWKALALRAAASSGSLPGPRSVLWHRGRAAQHSAWRRANTWLDKD